MARVYDLEQLIEPTLLGCDKARISIEVKFSNFVLIQIKWNFMEYYGIYGILWNIFRVSASVTINLLLLQMNLLDILFN